MTSPARRDPDAEIIELAGACTHDPLRWVNLAYDWGEGELAEADGPRAWQKQILNDLGEHLQDADRRTQPFRVAVSSGHGIGKSALIGQIVNWAMSTCEDCRIVTTANTENQLRTKTAPEAGKWTRLSLTAHWFNVTATAIFAKEKGHERTWKTDFVPWSEHNTEAFAGLHNKGRRIVLIFDEASAIADKVWEVAEGALTDENTEIIWIVFGNPTRATGRFRECFRRFRHRWHRRQIDAREVEGTNKEYLQQLVEDYGEDSDIVKIRVRGMFPATSPKQFISGDDVDRAFGKELPRASFQFAPVVIGVDPAWQGDDELVIVLRQGLFSKVLTTMAKNDNDVQVANIIARYEDEHHADAVFVDLGYGSGIVSAGYTMGRSWVLVGFGERAADAGCLNKRAEMWRDMRDWLKQGGALPPDETIYQDLIGPELMPRLDGKIALEPKEHMKQRGVPSPNRADALALTFAHPVARRSQAPQMGRNVPAQQSDYDPLA